MSFENLLEELVKREQRALAMGGPEKLGARKAEGRLNARERVERLFDPGTFIESGMLAVSNRPEDRLTTPADGKVAGFGRINGREAAVVANDFTVKGASSAAINIKKLKHMKMVARKRGIALVFLGESTGARMPDVMGASSIGSKDDPVEYQRMREVPWAAAVLGRAWPPTLVGRHPCHGPMSQRCGLGRMVGMIKVEGLSRAYGNFMAVDDISFECKPGTVTGFLGPNGAGKTTTMRVMVGLTSPTAGEVTIGGLHFHDIPNPGRHVGVLLDASAQHAGRTGREVLTIGAKTMGLHTAIETSGFMGDRVDDPYLSVVDLIRDKLPVSISIGLWTTLITYLVSIPLGIRKAVRDGSRFDVWTSGVIIVGYAVPSFLFAVLLIVLFAGGSYLSVFPLRGLFSDNWAALDWPDKILDYFWHIALPITALVIGGFATLTMLTKNSFLDEVNKQYVLTARAKGLTERRVLYGHVFRNAMLIVIATFPGAFVGAFFGGSLLIESIFSLDGLGLLGFTSVINRDYPVVFATLYIFSLLGLVISLISDLTYAWVDPRIDFETREI